MTLTNAPIQRPGCFVDGRPTDNRMAVSSSIGNALGLTGSSATVVAGQQYTMRVDTYHNPVAGRSAQTSVSSVVLDTTIDESGSNNDVGVYGQRGCNAVWLDNGSLVAIYRTRSSVGGAWSYWWRVNHQMGRQDTQPAISSAGIGNWGPRVSISPASTDWIQIVRGQGRVVALINTGTMLGSTVSVLHTNDSVQYTRTAGTLQIIYALDSQCQTWSSPITIATGVMPLIGGLAWTGGEWVACYTRNSDLSARVKRSSNLLDWSGSDYACVDNSNNPYSTPNLNVVANVGRGTGIGDGGSGPMPSMPLHCCALTCSNNGLLNGIWCHYADTAGTFTTGGGAQTWLLSYGNFLYGRSGNQGRTWAYDLTTSSGVGSGFAGVRDVFGGATIVNDYAWLNQSPATPGNYQPGSMSYTGFYT